MGLLTDSDFQHFIDYWHRLADEAGNVPLRSSIQLKHFAKTAPNFYLLERRDHFDVPVRLLGTIIDSFLPMVTQGQNFLDVYDETQRNFYADSIRNVCEYRVCANILRRIALANGTDIIIRSIAMPFRKDSGQVCYLGGIVQTPDQDQLLGLSSSLKRVTSSPLELRYIDLGFGVPPKSS